MSHFDRIEKQKQLQIGKGERKKGCEEGGIFELGFMAAQNLFYFFLERDI